MKHAIPLSLCVLWLCASCSTFHHEAPRPLIVGTMANYPPLIFQDGGMIAGAEADLVQMVADRLDRPLQFVILAPDEAVGALLTGEIHLLVSGLTLEQAQRLRIGFTEPYLQSGQMVVCRRSDRVALASMKTLKKKRMGIGVRKGSMAERIVPNMFRNAKMFVFADEQEAVRSLMSGESIALYMDDAPILWRIVSERDSTLALLPFAFSCDLYVWGTHPGDVSLQNQIDKMFQGWRRDGTLAMVLKKWLPLASK